MHAYTTMSVHDPCVARTSYTTDDSSDKAKSHKMSNIEPLVLRLVSQLQLVAAWSSLWQEQIDSVAQVVQGQPKRMPANFSIVDLLRQAGGATYRATNKMLRISHCFGSASRSACNHCRASRWKAIRPGNHFESIIASAGYMQHQVSDHLVFGTFQCQLAAGIISKPLTGFLLLHSYVKTQ